MRFELDDAASHDPWSDGDETTSVTVTRKL